MDMLNHFLEKNQVMLLMHPKADKVVMEYKYMTVTWLVPSLITTPSKVC